MEDVCNKYEVNDPTWSLVFEKHRKETFKNWVFDESEKCNASSLAEAGFYFIGKKDEPDVVQCFLCGKSLDGWEKHDDPWTEHKDHSPNCKFVKTMKPEMERTVYEMLDFIHEFWRRTVSNLFSDKEKMLISQQRSIKKQLTLMKKETHI